MMLEDAVRVRRLFGWPELCRQCTPSQGDVHATAGGRFAEMYGWSFKDQTAYSQIKKGLIVR